MRVSLCFLCVCVSVFLVVVVADPPAPGPWSGKSSIAPDTAFVFPPWPTHSDVGGNPSCTAAIDDTDNSADCCAATINANTPGTNYGVCKDSSSHNCPGPADKTCTAGTDNHGASENAASCPEFVDLAGGSKVYPRCRLVSLDCKQHGNHCWGTIQCYSNEAATIPTNCPAGGFLDVSSQSNPVIYHQGDFCYEAGNSDVSAWCGTGSCNDGYTYDPATKKCICAPPATIVNGHCTCPPGSSFVNGVCVCDNPQFSLINGVCQCPEPFVFIGGICCISNGQGGCTGGAPPGAGGDPQIGGFQGQSFQFHGLADETFNLISTPTLQLNGHFVYLSSGKCDYNDTECWTHPGTYIDQLGFSFGEHKLKIVASTHQVGLHMSMDGEVMKKGNYKLDVNGTEVSIKYKHHGEVFIKTHEFTFKIHNSDMFFNMETAMLDHHLLRVGAPKHTITDSTLCKKEETVDDTKFQTSQIKHQHNHGAVESAIEKKYGGVQVPLHGLIGQTWRNVLVCGKNWVGTVTDYVCSDLFASDYFFNFYARE